MDTELIASDTQTSVGPWYTCIREEELRALQKADPAIGAVLRYKIWAAKPVVEIGSQKREYAEYAKDLLHMLMQTAHSGKQWVNKRNSIFES